MKKAITSKYSEMVTVIERANWSISFYDVETGRHYERRVWYPVHGYDIYVQHRGGFYSILTDFNGKYDPQAISRYEVVDAEELRSMTAEALAHRPGKYDASEYTFEEVTRIWAYAIICNDADTEASTHDVVNDFLQTTAADIIAATEALHDAAEAMEQAGEAERKAADAAINYDPETAAKYAREARAAADAAELAADAAADHATSSDACSTADAVSEYAAIARDYADRATETAQQAAAEAGNPDSIETFCREQAKRYNWTNEETAENLAYYHGIAAANRAALALIDAYADAIGEYPTEDDPETQAAYRVARDEITGTSARATEYDRETVEIMTDIIARATSRPDLSKYAGMKYLEMDPEPAPTYQRHELYQYSA